MTNSEHNKPDTGLERDIRILKKRINNEKRQLRSKLNRLGINTGRRSIEDININPHQFLVRQDSYGYMEAKKAQSTQHNLEGDLRRLKQHQERQKSIRKRQQSADNDSNSC